MFMNEIDTDPLQVARAIRYANYEVDPIRIAAEARETDRETHLLQQLAEEDGDFGAVRPTPQQHYENFQEMRDYRDDYAFNHRPGEWRANLPRFVLPKNGGYQTYTQRYIAILLLFSLFASYGLAVANTTQPYIGAFHPKPRLPPVSPLVSVSCCGTLVMMGVESLPDFVCPCGSNAAPVYSLIYWVEFLWEKTLEFSDQIFAAFRVVFNQVPLVYAFALSYMGFVLLAVLIAVGIYLVIVALNNAYDLVLAGYHFLFYSYSWSTIKKAPAKPADSVVDLVVSWEGGMPYVVFPSSDGPKKCSLAGSFAAPPREKEALMVGSTLEKTAALPACSFQIGVLVNPEGKGRGLLKRLVLGPSEVFHHIGLGFKVTTDGRDFLATSLHNLEAIREYALNGAIPVLVRGNVVVSYTSMEPEIRFISKVADQVFISMHSSLWSMLGVKSAKPAGLNKNIPQAVSCVGPVEESFYRSTGLATIADELVLNHTASTYKGWSGAPLLIPGEGLRVCGIHQGYSGVTTFQNYATKVNTLRHLVLGISARVAPTPFGPDKESDDRQLDKATQRALNAYEARHQRFQGWEDDFNMQGSDSEDEQLDDFAVARNYRHLEGVPNKPLPRSPIHSKPLPVEPSLESAVEYATMVRPVPQGPVFEMESGKTQPDSSSQMGQPITDGFIELSVSSDLKPSRDSTPKEVPSSRLPGAKTSKPETKVRKEKSSKGSERPGKKDLKPSPKPVSPSQFKPMIKMVGNFHYVTFINSKGQVKLRQLTLKQLQELGSPKASSVIPDPVGAGKPNSAASPTNPSGSN